MRRPGFEPGEFHVGFVEDKVALGHFPLVLLFPLSVSFHRGSPYSGIIWGMNNMLVGSSSSEI
jgi:hypothetical protein